jgi:hypothetical protein
MSALNHPSVIAALFIPQNVTTQNTTQLQLPVSRIRYTESGRESKLPDNKQKLN